MIVVHTLKPSSLAHSLQTHCIGLTSLRSHASWAWPEKRDPTVTFYVFATGFFFFFVSITKYI